jgi:xanthine dehydrogenase accessory factor
MQAVDSEVLNQIQQWLAAGQNCWLGTVVETWGSSPRPVGSLLACNPQGQIVGSLSGGCVEDDLLDKLTQGELAAEQAQFFSYGVTPEETERLGLPCGGHLNIIVEPLQPDAPTKAHFTQLTSALASRQLIQRRLILKGDLQGDLKSAFGDDPSNRQFSAQTVQAHQELEWDADNQQLTHTYGPAHQLFIIGAGMVSQYLAQMALMLDYQVTVCDPREHLLDDFPVTGVTKVQDMPDDAVRAHANDRASAIVALTHDPRIDDMGLLEALQTEAFYVGAMGSSRTSANRRERLLALDMTPADLDKLHAPIGLPIGSKTPPEIAIAILAEITAVRKNVRSSAAEQLQALSA